METIGSILSRSVIVRLINFMWFVTYNFMQTDGISEMIIYCNTSIYKHLGNYTSP